jgi:hypothetical protein
MQSGRRFDADGGGMFQIIWLREGNSETDELSVFYVLTNNNVCKIMCFQF